MDSLYLSTLSYSNPNANGSGKRELKLSLPTHGFYGVLSGDVIFLYRSGHTPIPERNQIWHSEISFCPWPWENNLPTVCRRDPLVLSLGYVSYWTGSWIQWPTPLLLISSISNSLMLDNPFSIVRYFCSSLAVWYLASHLSIFRVISSLYIIFFIASFDSEEAIVNMSVDILD